MLKRLLSAFVSFLICGCIYSQQPIFSIQGLTGPTAYLMFDETYYKANQKFNYSAGVYVMANLPAGESRLSFRTGYFYDTKKYVKEYSTNYEWSPKKRETSYSYGNIPLLLEVAFNVRQGIYPFVSAGVILGYLLSAEQTNTLVNGEVYDGFPPHSNNKDKQTDFHACIGAAFHLKKRLLLRTEVFMSQQLDKDDGLNHDREGYFSFGLKLGLQFDFCFTKNKQTQSNIEHR